MVEMMCFFYVEDFNLSKLKRNTAYYGKFGNIEKEY